MQFKTKRGLVDIPNDEVLAASRDIASSAVATCETAGPAGSLGVGGGCLEVSSAEALCREWDNEAAWWEKSADKHQIAQNWSDAHSALAKSVTFDACARRLRRLMAAAKSRQPQDNT